MSICPQCHTAFLCGVVDTDKPAACWCMDSPRQPPADTTIVSENLAGKSCLCQACLGALRATRPATVPTESK
ncbi:MAG: cysteine-rich CWC family protein [Oxalicibacterium faecigallinarum]|uniref:cysteine-rich CWC family protein n=1 Tax=Oxalicibacterium faecigallinarum TaxID=573741 RepID=UPI001665D9B9|nr:cysteine-rich CWC family protein [Oxalicibacterium faecigallinarum]MDQ7969372.1 cysteine-rich CWC family protein [Oxalicibacterium faecigallinarum]